MNFDNINIHFSGETPKREYVPVCLDEGASRWFSERIPPMRFLSYNLLRNYKSEKQAQHLIASTLKTRLLPKLRAYQQKSPSTGFMLLHSLIYLPKQSGYEVGLFDDHVYVTRYDSGAISGSQITDYGDPAHNWQGMYKAVNLGLAPIHPRVVRNAAPAVPRYRIYMDDLVAAIGETDVAGGIDGPFGGGL